MIGRSDPTYRLHLYRRIARNVRLMAVIHIDNLLEERCSVGVRILSQGLWDGRGEMMLEEDEEFCTLQS